MSESELVDCFGQMSSILSAEIKTDSLNAGTWKPNLSWFLTVLGQNESGQVTKDFIFRC